MSTKIYNGFMFKGYKSLDTAYRECQTLRMAVQGRAQAETSKMIAEYATQLYDEVALTGKALNDCAVMNAYGLILTSLNEARAERHNSYFDLSFSMSIGLTNDKKVLGIFYTSKPELREVLTTHPDYEEYGYWDNTDRPEGVTLKAWNKRAERWNSILETGIPSEEMFSIEFVPEYSIGFPQKEIVQQYIPLYENRLQGAKRAYNMHTIATWIGTRDPIEIAKFLSAESEDALTKRLAATTEYVTDSLQKDLTIDDLLREI